MLSTDNGSRPAFVLRAREIPVTGAGRGIMGMTDTDAQMIPVTGGLVYPN
jgi:hypothetical protein